MDVEIKMPHKNSMDARRLSVNGLTGEDSGRTTTGSRSWDVGSGGGVKKLIALLVRVIERD
jgi:hypothetical protein